MALICVMMILTAGFGCSPEKFSDQTVTEIPSASVSDSKIPASSSPLQTPTPSPSPTPPPEPIRVSVIATGDMMCLYGQLNAAREDGDYAFDYCFNEIREKVSSADLAIGNLETLIAEGHKYTGPSVNNTPRLNAPESYLSAVVNCGFDVLIVANNHIYDREADGIVKTLQKIDEYGVEYVGAYVSSQARAPLIIDVKGIKIAILAYTDHLNADPEINEDIINMIDMYDEDRIIASIDASRAAGADYIIVYMHWGKENTHKVNSTQEEMAGFVANAGADIIIGSHPHCIQCDEIIETDRGGVPVFYSLGNLISSMGRNINKDSVLLNLVLKKDQVTGETILEDTSYTPTLCTSTDAGSNVVLPADLESISQSEKAAALNASRDRTVEVMSDNIARPE